MRRQGTKRRAVEGTKESNIEQSLETMHLQSPRGVERGVSPPARSVLHSACIPSPPFPISFPPSLLPPLVFVLNIHFACSPVAASRGGPGVQFKHAHNDTQPQHVQRSQTHLMSVHKSGRGWGKKNKKNTTHASTLHSPQRLHAHPCTYSTLHRHCGYVSGGHPLPPLVFPSKRAV